MTGAGWSSSTLGDLFEVQQGKAISPDARKGVSPRPFLRTANVLWGRLDLGTLDRMDFTDDEAERLALRPGDLLSCEGGEIGRTAIWNDEAPGCLYQNHVHRLRRKDRNVVPEFIMHWLQAGFLHLGRYEGVGNKTTIPNLSASRLRQLAVPVPEPREQRAIAHILDRIQAAIEVEERIVLRLKELKSATMAKVFREGLRGERLKKTEIGEMPEGWIPSKVGCLADLVSGGTPSKARAEFWQGKIPWASPKDMKMSRLWDVEDHISPEGLEAGSYLAPAKTIFVVIRGMILAKDLPIAIAEAPMSFNQDMKGLIPKAGIDPDYLLYVLQARKEDLARTIGTSAHGTRRIGTSSIEEMTVPLPSTEVEQREVAAAIEALERCEGVAIEKLVHLRSLFTSTLVSLMTREIRLSPRMVALMDLAFREARRPRYTGKVDEETLREIVRRIVEAVAPEKIILFGSAARGEMGPDSDIDLLVVAKGDHRDTWRTINRSLRGTRVPEDIVVVEPDHLDRYKDRIGLIFRPALREGRVIYAT